MRDVIKHKRGQVWKRVSSSNYTSGSVQSRNRPVLIVSSDEGNTSNGTVICVKITSQIEKSKYPINVGFKNDRNEDNVVLCNQIETVDKSELKEYMFTLSDDVMRKVEEARLISEGMEDYSDNVNVTINNIYKIMSKLETYKGHEYTDEQVANKKVKDVADKLDELYKYLKSFCDKSAEDIINGMSGADLMSDFFNRRELGKVDLPNDSDDKPISTNNSPKSSTKSKRRCKWTKEKMEQFLRDKDTMSPSEYAEKYGFDSVQKAMYSFYNIKYKYRDTYGELPDVK